MADSGNLRAKAGRRGINNPFGNAFADFDGDADFDKEEKRLVCGFCNRYYPKLSDYQKVPMMVMFEFRVAVALVLPNYCPGYGSDNEEKESYVGF